MNRKGFTLVELLVTIAILGIITGISIPTLRAVQANQEDRKYSIYLDNVNYSAKIYTDSYSEDLFEGDTGCNYVRYDDMRRYNLLKDIDVDGISCNTEYTVVKVVKYHEKYYYSPYIGCGSKTNNAVKADIFRPSKVEKISTCDGSNANAIVISATPNKSDKNTNKEVSPFVSLTSETGVKSSPLLVEYGYSKGQNINVINGWTKLNFNIPSREIQEKKIKATKTQVFDALSTSTTSKETGELYLVVKVSELQDLEGRSWRQTKKGDSNSLANYVIIGPYKVDNLSPKINSIKVKSSKDTHNDKKPILEIDASDEKYSSKEELKMCYSYKDDCPKPNNSKELNEMSRYVKYSSTQELNAISTDYNGSSHRIYVTIADAAGNTTTQYVDYKVSNSHTLTFDTDGGSSCSPIKQIENKAWGTKVVTDSGYANGTLCTTTKPGYTFLGWYTGKNGTGTQLKASDLATKDLTVYASWSSTKPSCTITASKKPNSYGWNNTNVTLTLNRNGQGITDYGMAKTKNSTNKKTSVTVSASGTTTYYGYVKTNSGSYTCSYTVKIDKKDPSCGSFSGGSTTWSNADYRTIKVGCKDSLSGCQKSKFSSAVTNEVKTKVVSITIKDKADNPATCKEKRNIYLDRTKPVYVGKSQKVSYSGNGFNWWYSTWVDKLSGLDTVEGGKSRLWYCYGSGSGCNRRCAKSPHDANTNLGTTGATEGYYLRNGHVIEDLKKGITTNDKIEVGTERTKSCLGGKYEVMAEVRVCDVAGNCLTKSLKYNFKKS